MTPGTSTPAAGVKEGAEKRGVGEGGEGTEAAVGEIEELRGTEGVAAAGGEQMPGEAEERGAVMAASAASAAGGAEIAEEGGGAGGLLAGAGRGSRPDVALLVGLRRAMFALAAVNM